MSALGASQALLTPHQLVTDSRALDLAPAPATFDQRVFVSLEWHAQSVARDLRIQ